MEIDKNSLIGRPVEVGGKVKILEPGVFIPNQSKDIVGNCTGSNWVEYVVIGETEKTFNVERVSLPT